MTRYFLTRLKIEGFRGINNESDPLDLRFQPDKVNSVFAINGVGKSSVFEGLCYAIRGFIPKLHELQDQERPQDYYCNRFHSKGTGIIELELQPDNGTPNVTVRVERDLCGKRTVTSPSGYSAPEGLLNSLNEDFALLDYRTFSRFIDSSPLDRGRSFSALLGLSRYSDFRQALQAVSDTRALKSDLELTALHAEVKAGLEAIRREQRQWIAAYHGVTGKQVTDIADVDLYVGDVLSALAGIDLIKESVGGKSLSELDFQSIKDQVKEAEGGVKRKQLEDMIAKITELDGFGDPPESIESEQSTILKLLQQKHELLASTRGDLFQKLHESAKKLIAAGEWEEPYKCPLCEGILDTEISALVENQLDQYKGISEDGRNQNNLANKRLGEAPNTAGAGKEPWGSSC